MSRETLLDEAIAKAKEAEDWQLVEWLRMARGGESAARWYTAKLNEARLDISKLMTDNVKLRELAQQMYPKAKAFLQMGVQLGCNDTLSYDWYLQLRELGVEVDA